MKCCHFPGGPKPASHVQPARLGADDEFMAATTPAQEARPGATLAIDPAAATRLLAACGVVVMLLSVGAVLAGELLGMQWLDRFDGDIEGSVPGWFHTLLLAAAAALWLVLAGREHAAGRSLRAWVLLGAVFGLASLDEVLAVHEELTEPLRELLGLSGALHYAWVVPGALVVAVLGAIVVRPVLALPAGPRGTIVLAGVLYVGGALGVELPSAMLADSTGEGTLGYRLLTQVEEGLETAGAVLLVAGLLRLLAVHDAARSGASRAADGLSDPAGAGPPERPSSRSAA
jgi:hypothetical protein